MSEERVRRLNATRSPATRYAGKGPAEVRNRLKHAASVRWWEQHDPEVGHLQREINIWSSLDGPDHARRGGLPTLSRHVAASPPRRRVLYRGIALADPSFKRGQIIDVPISSFTTNRAVAQRFADHRAKQLKLHPVVIEARNVRALHVSPLARSKGIGMQEWVGQGQFRVTRGGAMPRLVSVQKGSLKMLPAALGRSLRGKGKLIRVEDGFRNPLKYKIKKAMPNGVDLAVPRPIGTLKAQTMRSSALVTRRSPNGTLVQTRRKESIG